jgi:predicted ATP-grasp superfamily ATP-dependent carboligase
VTARPVLIAGVSTRAFAESAARAGYHVLAVDGFADLDLIACAGLVARVRDSAGRFQTHLAARVARELATPAVSYVASFENHPRAVEALARDRALWGNSPAVLARVRNPVRLARALTRQGYAVPKVRIARPTRATATRWLVKPRASGGGHGIALWRPPATGRVPPRAYFQERIAGIPGSIVFAADGRRAVAFGISRLLVGESAFGAGGFRYCGNILTGAHDPQFSHEAALFARSVELAAAVTQTFGLVGVNGIDFVARSGRPYPVEVNPRYTASMELVERAYGLSVFDIHAGACAGQLPAFDLSRARAANGEAVGKAVVYARRDTTVGDTHRWLEDDTLRDIPAPGEHILRGHPICTVFARARDAAACHRVLVARAAAVYRTIASRSRRSA